MLIRARNTILTTQVYSDILSGPDGHPVGVSECPDEVGALCISMLYHFSELRSSAVVVSHTVNPIILPIRVH